MAGTRHSGASRLDAGHTVLRFGHLTDVNALSFHPELELLASASYDGSVRVWDPRRPGAPPVALPDHGYSVWSLAFGPDGELVIGSGDRTARVWTTGTERLAEEACGHVGRDLTRGEWADYISRDLPYEETCP